MVKVTPGIHKETMGQRGEQGDISPKVYEHKKEEKKRGEGGEGRAREDGGREK